MKLFYKKKIEKSISFNNDDLLFSIRPNKFGTICNSSFVLHGYDRISVEFNILDLEIYDIELPNNDDYRKI